MILSEAQQLLRKAARDFAQNEIAPRARDWERADSRVPEPVLARMGELGFFGMLVPERYGGSGLDFVSYAVATEEFAAADCGICNLMNASNSPVCAAIRDYGSEAQRALWLPELAAGRKRGCFLLTEAGAGSDAAALETRAEPRGEGFVLRGSKCFATGGQSAHIAMVIARSDPRAGKRGMSAFVVPTELPGYRVVRLEDKLGHRNCDTCQIELDDVELGPQHVLGPQGAGYKIALSYLNGGRIGVAAQGVGVARAALEAARDYANTRVAFGVPIVQHQAVAFRLADMATRVQAARNMTLHAASLEDAGLPAIAEASMAKLFASQTAEWVTTQAIQIHGGYGYLTDYPVEKYYRDARVLGIYEGTHEIQRMVIARQLARG